MTARQKIFAITVGLCLFLFIIRLVHRRRLREEYSWLWLATGAGIVLLVVWYDLLLWLTELIGAVLPTTTLFLFSVLFLVLITLHYSIKISALTSQVGTLARKLALLEEKLESMEEEQKDTAPDPGKTDLPGKV